MCNTLVSAFMLVRMQAGDVMPAAHAMLQADAAMTGQPASFKEQTGKVTGRAGHSSNVCVNG